MGITAASAANALQVIKHAMTKDEDNIVDTVLVEEAKSVGMLQFYLLIYFIISYSFANFLFSSFA